jgi:type III pantothenate kinase
MSLTYFFDIGNTRGKFWKCVNGEVEAKAEVVHAGAMSELVLSIPPAFAETPDKICGVMVLDKEATCAFADICKARWGRPVEFVKSAPTFGDIKNGYEVPELLGADRWLGLIAVGKVDDKVCIVSVGTAFTLDVLENGVHQGGYILPGLRVMADALHLSTAGVRFQFQPTKSRGGLGRSTAEAVANGALAAYQGLISGVVAEYGISRTILTGGDAEKVSAHLALPHTVRSDLLLTGLQRYFSR